MKNEEIKEILDKLYQKSIAVNAGGKGCYSPYSNEKEWSDDIDILLDYITNLQQLYENALKINQNENKYRTELEDKYVVLQQENEFLKLNNPEQNIEHFRIVKENKRKIDNLRKENKILKENAEHNNKVVDKARWNEMIYKSRCEKANKLLKTIYKALPGTYNQLLIEIDNYLQGSDEE